LSRKSLVLSAAGHAGIILLAVILSASRGPQAPTGGDAIWVDVVTVEGPSAPPAHVEQASQEVAPENPPVEAQETPEVQAPPDTASAQARETPPDTTVQRPENPEVQHPEVENPAPPESFASVTSGGEAGTGSPGPATYEGRVFAAIRRNFRTSVQPEHSYRIEFTVNPDGTTGVETIRRSGVDAFDRAVEHALAVASIPPFPQGRTSPAVLRIEFLGPEQ